MIGTAQYFETMEQTHTVLPLQLVIMYLNVSVVCIDEFHENQPMADRISSVNIRQK